jgi:hypothetical protein
LVTILKIDVNLLGEDETNWMEGQKSYSLEVI